MAPETRESLIARLPDYADHAAWHEFAELYEPLIYGIGRRHGLQPADANDLVQDVFSAVASSIESFDPDQSRGKFRSWLFRVARNHSLSKLQRLAKGAHSSGDSRVNQMLNDYVAVDQSQQEFDAALQRRVFRWAARRVRDMVKPQTWEAFSKTAIDGQAPKQVAHEMNIPVGSIYLARSRVMTRLRNMVQQTSFDSIPLDDDSVETIK